MFIFRYIILFFLDIVETVVVAGAIFVVIYLFLVQPHQVVGSSMFPNFKDQEYILTDKISYKFRDPKRGEVVVFKSPEDADKDFIKRFIGLPGDKVKVEGGRVYINDKALDEKYLPPNLQTTAGADMQEGKVYTVEPNHYIVFGDNRFNSSDSRTWGQIDRTAIIGRAMFVYWPPPQVGFVPEVSY